MIADKKVRQIYFASLMKGKKAQLWNNSFWPDWLLTVTLYVLALAFLHNPISLSAWVGIAIFGALYLTLCGIAGTIEYFESETVALWIKNHFPRPVCYWLIRLISATALKWRLRAANLSDPNALLAVVDYFEATVIQPKNELIKRIDKLTSETRSQINSLAHMETTLRYRLGGTGIDRDLAEIRIEEAAAVKAQLQKQLDYLLAQESASQEAIKPLLAQVKALRADHATAIEIETIKSAHNLVREVDQQLPVIAKAVGELQQLAETAVMTLSSIKQETDAVVAAKIEIGLSPDTSEVVREITLKS